MAIVSKFGKDLVTMGIEWFGEEVEFKGFKRGMIVQTPIGIGHVVAMCNVGAIIHMINGDSIQDHRLIPYEQLIVNPALEVLYGSKV